MEVGQKIKLQPQVIIGECDYPAHCGTGPDCINATFVIDPDFYLAQIAPMLKNTLTRDGVEYVRLAIEESPNGSIQRLWASEYNDYL